MTNPKRPRQPARQPLSADDLEELQVQTREPRQTASYRVAADAPPKAAPAGPAKPRPVAPPILPPEPNAPAGAPREGTVVRVGTADFSR